MEPAAVLTSTKREVNCCAPPEVTDTAPAPRLMTPMPPLVAVKVCLLAAVFCICTEALVLAPTALASTMPLLPDTDCVPAP